MVHKSNRGYHDRVAGKYDQIYDSLYWRFYREISWRHLQRFLPAARPLPAADLGCGTGWFGKRLLKAGAAVTFVDPSIKMLEVAREAVAAEGARGLETRFVQAGLEDLHELADGSLAFATGQGDPLSFCEDPRRALQELHRVLCPGASLVLSVDSRIGGVRSLQVADSPQEMLELLRSGRTTWRGHRQDERFGMKMFLPDELDNLLRKTGFEPRSWIAKTCLVQRANEPWLEEPQQLRTLIEAEERVHADKEWFGLAGHLQVAATRT